ncbi:MAG TPA: hypothetical protein VFP29_12485 [Methyloceanibacter sp.]|nr:hypothetical protein [Methyloceanibacter sp.]
MRPVDFDGDGRFGVSEAVFCVMSLLVLWVFYRLEKDNNGFRFADALMTDGRADHTKIGYFIAIVTLTWVVFHYAVHFQLTEWLATVYVGAAVVAVVGYKGMRVGGDAVQAWKESKTGSRESWSPDRRAAEADKGKQP